MAHHHLVSPLSLFVLVKSSYWGDHNWEGKGSDLIKIIRVNEPCRLSEDDENDLTARKAFEALLRVSLLQPTSPRFNQFADEVRERARRDYGYSFYEGEEVSAA
jgi:atrial natriuretic peptide receptor A